MTVVGSPIIAINRARQICFVVHNLDQSMERMWANFGIGPWKVNLRDQNSANAACQITDMVYMDKPARFSYRVASATLEAGLIIELLQPLAGESTYSDFLQRHGEGLHHIGWHFVDSADELQKVTETMEQSGFPCLQSAKTFVSMVRYFDTTSVLGAILEVCYDDPAIKRPEPLYIYPTSKGE